MVLGSGDKWCPTPGELPAFLAMVHSLPVYGALGDRAALAIELTFENAG